MKKIILIVLTSLMISSCVKDKDLTDEIIFVDLNPDLILNPVDSVGLHPSGLCQQVIPFPSDSIISTDIDINQDGQNDYRFTFTNFYEWVSASYPCANYNSIVQINALINGNKVVIANEEMHDIKVLNCNDNINKKDLFYDNAFIYRNVAMGNLYFGDFSGEGYIGFKLSNGELGWIKINFQKDYFLCIILEYAYNKNVASDINAGQIK